MYEGKIIKNFPFRQEERRQDMKTYEQYQLIEELLFPTSINCIAKGKNKKIKIKKKLPNEEVNRREPSPSVTIPWFVVNFLKISL
jgi:hypothetical protein